VDRQTNEPYTTYDVTEAAGLAIKRDYPMLQVAVYDRVDGGGQHDRVAERREPLRSSIKA
jgi:hypothetical protein